MIFKTTKGGGALTHSLGKNNRPTEADMAYEILQARGTSMHYQSLIKEALENLGTLPEAVRIAAALTQINLDTRFVFYGQGEWGLRVWESAKNQQKRFQASSMNKASAEDDDKNDLEDLEEAVDEDVLEADDIFDDRDESSHNEKW